MADTQVDLRDPNYTPPLAKAIPLGIQHVLAMFVSNVTPAIIVAGAAGFGFGSKLPRFSRIIIFNSNGDVVRRCGNFATNCNTWSNWCRLANCARH